MHPGMKFLIPNRRIGFKMPVKGWRCSPQFPTMWVVYDAYFSPENTVIYGEIDVWDADRLEQWEFG